VYLETTQTRGKASTVSPHSDALPPPPPPSTFTISYSHIHIPSTIQICCFQKPRERGRVDLGKNLVTEIWRLWNLALILRAKSLPTLCTSQAANSLQRHQPSSEFASIQGNLVSKIATILNQYTEHTGGGECKNTNIVQFKEGNVYGSSR
jgi:hypothetical protein